MSKSLLTILFLGLATSWGVAQDRWTVADAETLRLPPTTFSELPAKIIKYLQGRRCTIPQTYFSVKPHNVISGEFTRRGQTDWAVLCSSGQRSSILIFRRGSTKSVAEIAKVADKDYLQTVDGEGKIAFSRAIEPVGENYIESHYKSHGGRRPPRIAYQGINDAFEKKSSVVRYFYRGKWLELQGAD